MRMSYIYDYVVMNENIDEAVKKVVQIIHTVRCRTILHKEMIDQINATFSMK